MSEFGYAGKILTVALPEGKSNELPTSQYSAEYLGGRGFGGCHGGFGGRGGFGRFPGGNTGFGGFGRFPGGMNFSRGATDA